MIFRAWIVIIRVIIPYFLNSKRFYNFIAFCKFELKLKNIKTKFLNKKKNSSKKKIEIKLNLLRQTHFLRFINLAKTLLLCSLTGQIINLIHFFSSPMLFIKSFIVHHSPRTRKQNSCTQKQMKDEVYVDLSLLCQVLLFGTFVYKRYGIRVLSNCLFRLSIDTCVQS